MLILRGAPALSQFRSQKLLAQLQSKVPEISCVVAEFQHYVKIQSSCEKGLSERQADILARLLTYGPKIQQTEPENFASQAEFLVVPRPGTISPWSVKHPILLTIVALAWFSESSEAFVLWCLLMPPYLETRKH